MERQQGDGLQDMVWFKVRSDEVGRWGRSGADDLPSNVAVGQYLTLGNE
jgi:hypothetical protein